MVDRYCRVDRDGNKVELREDQLYVPDRRSEVLYVEKNICRFPSMQCKYPKAETNRSVTVCVMLQADCVVRFVGSSEGVCKQNKDGSETESGRLYANEVARQGCECLGSNDHDMLLPHC